MTRDSIFRIASMTKPFTSLAIMMLAEEGKIQLPVPVSRYLPEFKDLKVGVEKKDPATGKTELVLETPSREMTIQDLLRHTSGLTYGFIGKSMVKDRYNEAKLMIMHPDKCRVGYKTLSVTPPISSGNDMGLFAIDRRAGTHRGGCFRC